MYVDPYAAQVTPGLGYAQGGVDQCCRLICWILVSLFVLGLIIWLIRWMFMPGYTRHVVVRHNLVSAMHKSAHLAS
jgi:phage shock protein PspC (stress-responsive transcriptional regulator)